MNFRNIDNILRANGWRMTRYIGFNYKYCKPGLVQTITVNSDTNHYVSINAIKDIETKTGLSLI